MAIDISGISNKLRGEKWTAANSNLLVSAVAEAQDNVDNILGWNIDITDLSGFEVKNGYLTSGGIWSNINNKYQFKVIPIRKPNTILSLTANSVTAYYTALKEEPNPVSGETPDYAGDITGSKYVAANSSIDFTLPNDATYLLVWILRNDVDITPSAIDVSSQSNGRMLDVKTEVEEILENVTKIEDNIDDINEELAYKVGDTVELTSFTGLPRVNGFVTANGTWTNINENNQFVVLDVGFYFRTLILTGNSITTSYVCFLKNYTPPVQGVALDFSDVEGYTSRIAVARNTQYTYSDIPNDARYVLIWTKYNTNDCTPIEFYFATKSELGYLEDNVYKNSSVRWLALGDSITEGVYSVAGDEAFDDSSSSHKDRNKSWTITARDIRGYTLDNRGIGGMGYIQKSPDVNRNLNLRDLLDLGPDSTIHIISQNDPTTYIDLTIYDIITINLGINDWKSPVTWNKIGTIDDTTSADTMVANLKYSLLKIATENPKAKVIVFSPINSAWEISSNPSTAENNWAIGYDGYSHGQATTITLDDVSNIIKDVCEYYGVEYVDLLHRSVVNRINIKDLLLDNVHPSEVAHKTLGREIARFL